jgi:ADP-dependent NAD(P)H-hydrate dehydratase / NAD(P)H-hydrate epimerase
MNPSASPVFLSEQIRAIEAQAFARAPQPPLMERAGLAAAELARTMTGERGGPLLVLAGPGNNGGDALVAARHLRRWWFDVAVVFTGDPARLSADARSAFDAWIADGNAVTAEIPAGQRWQLAIDGLFGIGLRRTLDDRHAGLVAAAEATGAPVLAIDIPSGLHADNGVVLGSALRASRTITFLGRKAGLYTNDGPDYCGHIHLDLLGQQEIPPPAGHGWLIDDSAIRLALPPRRRNSHKGLFGDVAVIGGSEGMVGAALLAGRAALRLGAGRVLVGLLCEGPQLDLQQPDLMLRSAEALLSRNDLGCAVVGPGLGQSDAARHALSRALELPLPLVLDADALNLVAATPALQTALSRRGYATLLTPHPAEAGRLLGSDSRQVQADRVHSALALAKRFNAAVVLKGCGSVCAFPEGDWHLNTSGNPGMATAGMGDVLAGLLGALIAQGAGARAALLAAVRVHGLAADQLAASGIGPVGLTASETIDAARAAWNRLA